MQHRAVLIVFVRAPRLGAVKQRLAAGIGMVEARQFYVETTNRILRRITANPRWEVWLGVTPDQAASSGRYWPDSLRRFPQGCGDLGVRMARALRFFPRRPVVLVGSDIPDISEFHIAEAFSTLGRCDLTFGPARDGGYWLVGARDAAMVQGLFRDIKSPWSP